MKKEFSKNTTEVFTKTIFHYIPKILKYIDEIKDPRKNCDYSMRYLIFSEMLMFLSEGKSQRFIETAFEDTNYLENMQRIIKENIKSIPDSEIYTDVFSRIENTDIEDFKYKVNYQMIRNKTYENDKIVLQSIISCYYRYFDEQIYILYMGYLAKVGTLYLKILYFFLVLF